MKSLPRSGNPAQPHQGPRRAVLDQQEISLGSGFDRHEATIIALHCSESGARPAIDELLSTLFGKAGIEIVSVPGGCWWPARVAGTGEGRLRGWLANRVAGAAGDAVRGTLRRRGLEEVLLVGHQGCGWYRRLHPGSSESDLVRLQGEDLYRTAREIGRWSGAALTVHGYILVADQAGSVTARALF